MMIIICKQLLTYKTDTSQIVCFEMLKMSPIECFIEGKFTSFPRISAEPLP